MADIINPSIWQIVTWVISVGIGVVFYKFYDRFMSHKETKPNAWQALFTTMDGQIRGLHARIEQMEAERLAYHETILKLTSQVAESKATIAILEDKLSSLEDRYNAVKRRGT